MAEKVLQQLEEHLNCSICLDTYTDPKLLQCYHVYCRKCLVPLVDRDQQGRLGLTCPICRQVTPIPDRGVAGLQSAFHINHFLEIKESLENSAPEKAMLCDVMTTFRKVSSCSVHEGKELELYCETCGELICWKCIAKGNKHRDHDYKELIQAFKTYSQEIKSLLEPMEKQVKVIKKALVQLDICCGEISDQRAAIADNIHGTFRQLQEVLNVRETELIGQLDLVTQGKLKDLAAQRNQIETTLAQLNSCLHFMRETLRTGNERNVLMMKKRTVSQAKVLTTSFQPESFEPSAGADIIFSAPPDVTASCQNHGLVFSSGWPDPSKCYLITDKRAKVAVGKMSAAILLVVSLEGKPCKESIVSKFLESDLVSEISCNRVRCVVERSGKNQYKISYQPAIKGRHQLHVKVQGQHIRRSPFSLEVKSPVQKLGTPILTIGGVVEPWGIAVNQRGEVVVAELRGNCVSLFCPSGKKLQSFGTHGSGRVAYPCEIAVDAEGNILVADNGNHRIQRFTSEGQFLTSVGTKGSRRLQFCCPTGIAYNTSNNKVYVTDSSNHRVQILNFDLTFFSTFHGKGLFRYPCGIACDNTGKVYVADRYNHRVQVFTADGEFLWMFGHGPGRRKLNEPVGIAVDASGIVYVSEHPTSVVDHYDHRVSVFTSEGHFVTSFGRLGKGPGEFASPCGLAVDNSGVVYVCDRDNYRVQLF